LTAVYIVDASAVVEYLITGSYTANTRVLFSQVTPEDRLIVPEFCLLECTNVLWKHVRFQGMLESQAEKLLSHLRKLPLKRVPVKAVLASALDIGLAHQLAIYDSAYIALARRSNHPLITVDQAQQKASVSSGIALKPITDFAP
jgi:predicted nucleic acid-binding protein